VVEVLSLWNLLHCSMLVWILSKQRHHCVESLQLIFTIQCQLLDWIGLCRIFPITFLQIHLWLVTENPREVMRKLRACFLLSKPIGKLLGCGPSGHVEMVRYVSS